MTNERVHDFSLFDLIRKSELRETKIQLKINVG